MRNNATLDEQKKKRLEEREKNKKRAETGGSESDNEGDS
jgi:hypothetical protein